MSKTQKATAQRPKRGAAIYILADREDLVRIMDADYLADYMDNGFASYLTAEEAEEGRMRGDAYDEPGRTRVVGFEVKPFLPKIPPKKENRKRPGRVCPTKEEIK